jgi:hypothetical protein
VRLCDEDGKNYYIQKPIELVLVFTNESYKINLSPGYAKKSLTKNKDEVLTQAHKITDLNKVAHF